VAGTHGKTTTTSLVAAVLAEGRYDPTIIVRRPVSSLGSNAGSARAISSSPRPDDRTGRSSR